MTFTRQNIWELGGDWAEPILWYARGVKAMRARLVPTNPIPKDSAVTIGSISVSRQGG